MSLTRAQIETVLIRRCGQLMVAIGLDGTTADGTNPDLSDPIAEGLRSMGLYAADPSNVADADLATVSNDLVPQLADIAELRALESILGNVDTPNEKVANGQQDWGAFAERLEKTIARRDARCLNLYGYGAGSMGSGTVSLDFQQTYTDPDPCDY